MGDHEVAEMITAESTELPEAKRTEKEDQAPANEDSERYGSEGDGNADLALREEFPRLRPEPLGDGAKDKVGMTPKERIKQAQQNSKKKRHF